MSSAGVLLWHYSLSRDRNLGMFFPPTQLSIISLWRCTLNTSDAEIFAVFPSSRWTLTHLLLYHLVSLCFLIDGSLCPKEKKKEEKNSIKLINNKRSCIPLYCRCVPPVLPPRDVSALHMVPASCASPSPLHNLRRKYIQDIAFRRRQTR